MKKIFVIGAHGQVGTELNFLASQLQTHFFLFFDKDDLDITDEDAVNNLLLKEKFEAVINCAAYTAVDKAESEKELAFKINAIGAANLASACKQSNAKFIHISTDFIFEGIVSRPLLETDSPNPISVYGASKLEGEKLILQKNSDSLIIRSSWVYSSFGNNFVKTILRLCNEKKSLNIIYDQIGTPTYARDLADVILKIIFSSDWKPGIYNFSNEGVASWYDFAIAITEIAKLETKIIPIETREYPTPAQRPQYSVLNKAKIKAAFDLEIPYWRESLEKCIALLV